jgi:hypothetical protein
MKEQISPNSKPEGIDSAQKIPVFILSSNPLSDIQKDSKKSWRLANKAESAKISTCFALLTDLPQ